MVKQDSRCLFTMKIAWHQFRCNALSFTVYPIPTQFCSIHIAIITEKRFIQSFVFVSLLFVHQPRSYFGSFSSTGPKSFEVWWKHSPVKDQKDTVGTSEKSVERTRVIAIATHIAKLNANQKHGTTHINKTRCTQTTPRHIYYVTYCTCNTYYVTCCRRKHTLQHKLCYSLHAKTHIATHIM